MNLLEARAGCSETFFAGNQPVQNVCPNNLARIAIQQKSSSSHIWLVNLIKHITPWISGTVLPRPIVLRNLLSNSNNYHTGNPALFIRHDSGGIAIQMLKYIDFPPYLWPIGFYAKTSVMILPMGHSWNNWCRFFEPCQPSRNALPTSLQLSRALGHARGYSIVHCS